MRRGWLIAWLACLYSLVLPGFVAAQAVIQHHLHVTLYPPQQTLQVTDTITLPALPSGTQQFVLHAGLHPVSLTPGVQLLRQPALPAGSAPPPLEQYTVTLPADLRTFTLRYEGIINHPVSSQDIEYRLGMRATPGLISADGVYLSPVTAWYPQFGETTLTFRLDVQLPQGWEVVSQGERTRHDHTEAHTSVRWESPLVQEGIYLIAGPFTVYSQPVGTVQAMVFLRTPDAALAQTYLQAAGQYLRFYQRLLGPYLYAKFALAENVWESGLGMPSLSLLGSKVIRLPFIVHSSYPHEILHNWWGNGVFVDLQEGNWAEGLTAYLADHLLQEQRGSGAAYRRGLLQKYTDYVARQDDLPLTAFRARHSAATEAIGYGKALMLFHMLRQHLGEAPFLQVLRAFYRDYALRPATFGDLQQAFAAVAGEDGQQLFQQWVRQAGAPELRIGSATVQPEGAEYLLHLRLEQSQVGPGYRVRVPLAVSLHGVEQAFQTVVDMAAVKQATYTLRLPASPRRLDVDPEFDVFRRLHQDELPPAFSQLFGAERSLIVLPHGAAPVIAQGYHRLAQTWARTLSQVIDIRWDHDLEALPRDTAVWLFGWDNRFLPEAARALAVYDVALNSTGVRLDGRFLARAQHTVALTVRHPHHPQGTLAWVAGQTAAALPGLGRKLPHYGTYSFLSFTGEEPVNTLQGQWPVLKSPLSVQFAPPDGRASQERAAKLLPRPALAPPP